MQLEMLTRSQFENPSVGMTATCGYPMLHREPAAPLPLLDLGCTVDNAHTASTRSRRSPNFPREVMMRCILASTLLAIPSTMLIHTAHAQLIQSNIQTTLVSGSGRADGFGSSIAISGDTALVGAKWHDDDSLGMRSGAVYAFVRIGTSWSLQAVLLASDQQPLDQFGRSIVLDGDTALIVGDMRKGVYVFVRDGDTWTEQANLMAEDTMSTDAFGIGIAISGEIAVVGSVDVISGVDVPRVHIFVREGAAWVRDGLLVDTDDNPGYAFGTSVAISGDTVVVGDFAYDGAATNSGAAYVYSRATGSWQQQDVLIPDDPDFNGQFGYSVSVSGDTALIGANLEGDGTSQCGAAYVFTRRGSAWTQQAKLRARATECYAEGFGSAVLLENDVAIIGAPGEGDSSTTGPGAAHVFVRSGATWNAAARLTADDGIMFDRFGFGVGLSGDTAIVSNTSTGSTPSRVYVFSLRPCGDAGMTPGAGCDDVRASAGGCGCALVGAGHNGPPVYLLFMGAVMLVHRRRRTRGDG